MTYLAFINFILAGLLAQSFAANPALDSHTGWAVTSFGVGILCAIRGAKS